MFSSDLSLMTGTFTACTAFKMFQKHDSLKQILRSILR